MKNIKAFYLQESRSAKSGDRIIDYGRGTFYALPYSIEPTSGEHDYRSCKNCLDNHKTIVNQLKKRVINFPNCCESHKRLLSLREFNRSDYKDAAIQCADKVIFTYQHILNKQSSNIWQAEIFQYLDNAIDSFGTFPEGYGAPFLLTDYISYVRQLIDNNKSIRQEIVNFVHSYFDRLFQENENLKKDPIQDLCQIYNDWLNLVPFDLPFLKDIKDVFRKNSPLMIYEDDTSVSYLISESQLLVYLATLTNNLLVKVGVKIASIKDEDIKDFYNAFIRQELLFSNKIILKEKSDLQYVTIIEKWMNNQSSFLNKINTLGEIGTRPIRDDYPNDSYKEAFKRIEDFKGYLEYNDLSILIDSKKKEKSLQLLFRIFWRNTDFDFNSEPNNGRGSLDFKVSKGAADKTIIEFKLASNTKLKQNMQNQVQLYNKANNTDKSITVLFFFNEKEEKRIDRVLEELQIKKQENIVIIDCTKQKLSASNVKG